MHSDTSVIVQSILSNTDGAAAPDTAATVTALGRDREVSWAPLEHFAHRPDNPRWEREYDPDQDPELEAFIATLDEYGVLQAVSVTSRRAWLEQHPEHEERFDDQVQWVVVMGNRRLAAARRSDAVDGLPFHRNDKLAQVRLGREASIVENYHRKGLDPIREAAEMAAVLDETGESRRAFADRMRISHTQVNQRLQLLDLVQEFQGMVSDLYLSVQKALPIAVLDADQQRALLELGPPYTIERLSTPEEDVEPGKTLSTASSVTIRKNSSPNQVADTLRTKLTPEMLTEVVKLLQG